MLMLYLAEALRFIMWMMLAGNVIEAPELELLCCKNLCLVQVRQCVIFRSASNGIVTNTVSGAELRFGTKVWFGLFTFHTFMLPVVGTIDVLSFPSSSSEQIRPNMSGTTPLIQRCVFFKLSGNAGVLGSEELTPDQIPSIRTSVAFIAELLDIRVRRPQRGGVTVCVP